MPISFKHATLDNGLNIIAEVDPDAHSSAIGFFVRTGARDERTKVMGVSHFLEHMMFKGTDDISADELNRRFDAMGARNNAFTTSEMTCFYAQIIPEQLAPATELIAKMMRPALRQDDFDTEKHVILEEIAMYKDSPFWVLYEEAVARHYREHPLGFRVLGTSESITDLQRDEMLEYFEHRYSGDNTTVALAGNLDFERCVADIDSLCGSWQATSPKRDQNRPLVGAGSFTLHDENVNRAYLLGLANAPSMDDDRRYAAGMVAHILGAPDNSRFHWSLIETGIAEEAHAAFADHDHAGDFMVYASGDPERADAIWDTMKRDIAHLGDSLEEDDLVRLRSKTLTAATIGGERPGDRMQRIGRTWTTLGVYRSLEEELEKINSVTIDDMRALLNDFPIEPITTGTMLPA